MRLMTTIRLSPPNQDKSPATAKVNLRDLLTRKSRIEKSEVQWGDQEGRLTQVQLITTDTRSTEIAVLLSRYRVAFESKWHLVK